MANIKEIGEIYKCGTCGNIVEILLAGGGELVCCGQPMEKMIEKSSDEGMEKHLPVIEETKNEIRVKIGSIPHPMLEEHHIMWIEIWGKDNHVLRKYLKPGDSPEAEFDCELSDIVSARELCNIHGLWTKIL